MVAISETLGRNRSNRNAGDVAAITAALASFLVRRGENPVIAPDGFVEAIADFQFTEKLDPDGVIGRNGDTLRRINALLKTNGPLPPSRTRRRRLFLGGVSRIDPPDNAPTAFTDIFPSPVPQSFRTEFHFQWLGLTKPEARILYFELDENVVPNLFGVVVPPTLRSFDSAHIFFHPNPGFAGFNDATYQSRAGWGRIFHYMSDSFSAQFTAAGLDQILIMPVFTASTLGSAGIFPERWQEIVSAILADLNPNPFENALGFKPLRNIVLSSFSAGISYSHHFRQRANGMDAVVATIDFDGLFSTFRTLSAKLVHSGARSLVFHQGAVRERDLFALDARGNFPVPDARWHGGNVKWPSMAGNMVHGGIPQAFMHFASRRALSVA
jgi:hypothetical protein